MEKHLIFMDIDGTLVDDTQNISDRTISTIQDLQENGNIFYLATGRMFASAQIIAHAIDNQVGIVASNGSIYSLDDQLIAHHLQPAVLAKIYQTIMPLNLSAFFFSDHQVFYTHTLPDYFRNSDHNRIASPDPNNYVFVANQQMLLEHASEIVNGIIIEDQNFKLLESAKTDLQSIDNLNLSSSNKNNIELIPRHISKATAIAQIQQKLAIPSTQTIAFGDGKNDLEMFHQSGIAVAMGNSSTAIQHAANYVTTTNLDDGVAKFLNNYFK